MASSDYLREQLVKWAFTADSVTRPAAWFASLHKADPGLAGANEVAVGDDTAYARIAATFDDTAVNGQAKNTGTVTFPAAAAVAASYTVTHFGVWDAATTGNFLGGGALDDDKVVEDATVLSFGINDLVAEIA